MILENLKQDPIFNQPVIHFASRSIFLKLVMHHQAWDYPDQIKCIDIPVVFATYRGSFMLSVTSI